MWRLIAVVLILAGVLFLKFAGPIIGGEISAILAVAAFLSALAILIIKVPSHIKESMKRLNRPGDSNE
ncbi:MAG: hypothetical protein ABIF28_06585 [Pseudomonadota bacterium]